MKLIVAIVPDTAADDISHALTSSDLRVTRIASTGGFLRRGHSTLLIGLEEPLLENALKIVREKAALSDDTEEKKGVIFVLKVDQYIHF